MTLTHLRELALDKSKFNSLTGYSDFCQKYLEFIARGLQAVIISRNENNYHFFQYKKDGNFAITRPIKSNLMLSISDFHSAKKDFYQCLPDIRSIIDNFELRENINKFVYTCQQCIGATLDSLPPGKTNSARKLNGDLFESFIRKLLAEIGIDTTSGWITMPVIENGSCIHGLSA